MGLLGGSESCAIRADSAVQSSMRCACASGTSRKGQTCIVTRSVSDRSARIRNCVAAATLLARQNDVFDQWIDLVGPAVAAEYPVMSDAGLHVVSL
jgi:hypothetical protein